MNMGEQNKMIETKRLIIRTFRQEDGMLMQNGKICTVIFMSFKE